MGAVAALACVAIVAAVTRGFASSNELDISLASGGSVQLCTDINFGGTCKNIGLGRYNSALASRRAHLCLSCDDPFADTLP